MMNEQNPSDDSCAAIRCTKRCGGSRSSSISLNDDLLIEILSRLPPKSLIRFMCVSKSWSNLISNSLASSPVSALLYYTQWWRKRHTQAEYVHLPGFRTRYKQAEHVHLSGFCKSNRREEIEFCDASLQTSGVNLTQVHSRNGLFLLKNDEDAPPA